jgi:hypothetical protein
VQRVWSARGLKPHLVKTFKLSNDPRFEEKLVDERRPVRDTLGAGGFAERLQPPFWPGSRGLGVGGDDIASMVLGVGGSRARQTVTITSRVEMVHR